jgi:hypothetical protein
MAMRRRWRWLAAGGALLAPALVLGISCTSGLGEQDCLLLAEAVGTVEKETCGLGDAGFTQGYSDTVNLVANGNCAHITSVRDQDELVECIFCLLNASCYDAGALCSGSGLDAAVLPDACANQLQL